jgi:hypothetical protein
MGDFDFLVGSWSVLNRKLTQRLVGSDEWSETTAKATNWRVFGGLGNVDEIVFHDGRSGLSLRVFDNATQAWSIYWAASGSSRLDPPVTGRFTDGRGVFYGDDTHLGDPVRVRFIWSDITPTSARWEQAFSTDGGETWEINWIMEFTRI